MPGSDIFEDCPGRMQDLRILIVSRAINAPTGMECGTLVRGGRGVVHNEKVQKAMHPYPPCNQTHEMPKKKHVTDHISER